LRPPGLVFAICTTSATVFAGSVALTTITFDAVATRDTAAKSRNGSEDR
jgi:hypothetical protein